MNKELQTVETSRGLLRYYRDWERYEGGIVMENAQTISRYKEINDQHPKCDDYGVFFAFSKEQFAKGVAHLKELGFIKDESELQQDSATGVIGTHDGITGFLGFYDESRSAIPKECDPQEVYFYEYNNHESMYAWDGDVDAIKLIISYWGVETAKKIKRYNAAKTIGQIIKNK